MKRQAYIEEAEDAIDELEDIESYDDCCSLYHQKLNHQKLTTAYNQIGFLGGISGAHTNKSVHRLDRAPTKRIKSTQKTRKRILLKWHISTSRGLND